MRGSDIGWFQIRMLRGTAEALPRWIIAFYDGRRWYVPGLAEDPHKYISHIGPQLPIPVEFE